MDKADELNVALEHVLAAPAFRRSPVLARLLRYLVAESAAGRGPLVKSYAVAVDGLGRPEDFDAHSDSYARVHVSRLRRALDSFYEGPGKELAMRLQVPHGSYVVDLVPTVLPVPAAPPPPAWGWRTLLLIVQGWWQWHRRATSMTLVGLVLLLGAGLLLSRWLRAEGEWGHNDFPRVAIIAAEAPVGQVVPAAQRQQFILEMISAFNLMEGVQVVDRINDDTDYVVELGLRPARSGTEARITLIDHVQDRIVWSREWVAPETSGSGQFDGRSLAIAIAFDLTQGTGPIHADPIHLASKPETPHGCWLVFAHLWQQQRLVTGEELDHCSRHWLSASPDDPLAAMVRGWVLVDSVLADPHIPNRSAMFDEADALARRNLRLNPNRLSATLLALHVACFGNDPEEFQRIADRMLKRYGELPDIRGSVGLHMLMRGDLRGRSLVQQALQTHFNPPPRFLLGLFIAAVLEDDVRAARMALAAIPSSGRDAQYALLSAAVAAREGRIGPARMAWVRAVQAQRVHGQPVEAILDAGAFPAPMKQRLRRWLAPVSRD